MPKLLSEKEAMDFAAKMTAEYGLPPPILHRFDPKRTYGNARLQIVRAYKSHRFKVFDIKFGTKIKFALVKEIYADDFENMLLKLRQELHCFDIRTQIAEEFRDQYIREEANEAFDKAIRQDI